MQYKILHHRDDGTEHPDLLPIELENEHLREHYRMVNLRRVFT
jgi:hypothetical protein